MSVELPSELARRIYRDIMRCTQINGGRVPASWLITEADYAALSAEFDNPVSKITIAGVRIMPGLTADLYRQCVEFAKTG